MTRLHIVFHVVLSVAVWRVSMEEDIVVFGYEGSGAEIKCPYTDGYKDYGKYLCSEKCSNYDILVETQWQVSRAEKGRYSLNHDTERRFTVLVSKLSLTDTGTYWCGVSKSGYDIYSKVLLNVVKDRCCDHHTIIQANNQAPVTISCPYNLQHIQREKYFCKGTQPSACYQQALVTSKQNNNPGKISLRDNKTAGVFTVTITDLTQQSSGFYLCGIRMDQGLDIYTMVNLEVKVITTTTSLPTTPLPQTSDTSSSSSSKSVLLTSLSSTGSTHGSTNSTSVFSGLAVILVPTSLAVLVLGVLLLSFIMCRCRRRRMEPPQEKGQQKFTHGSTGNYNNSTHRQTKHEYISQNTETARNVELASCEYKHSIHPDGNELQSQTGQYEDINDNTQVYSEVKRKHAYGKPRIPPPDDSVYGNIT
ncbi:hypothetical protein DPEC_G00077180 [Dallia pectoralis]|uniref:Uncharacterized protein n=1 Tax=Dallia pectoralis TaxID=75939 RepID=A0ACC2H4P9_DALPE|nr:hypothetical protein DPEC_G00077180 [Dallia pectoralis]